MSLDSCDSFVRQLFFWGGGETDWLKNTLIHKYKRWRQRGQRKEDKKMIRKEKI